MIENYGRNVRFTPRTVLRPRSRADVLAALDTHRGRRIRAMGSLHSWSELVAHDDVVLDMRSLDGIRLTLDAAGLTVAEIDAGCTIDAALDFLHANGGLTLPAYGMFGGQTIAGAIATATHGSGLPSLSHFVESVALATYDRVTGRARIVQCADGDELRAARCSLGCLGIIVAVRLRVMSDYLLEERTEWHDSLETVLPLEADFPRTQSYLVPWSWRVFVQLRRPLPAGSRTPGVHARVQRVLRRVGMDLVFNGLLKRVASGARGRPGSGLQAGPPAGVIPWAYRQVFPAVARHGMTVVDEARRLLMMRHDLYRHVEMELFVPARAVLAAAAWIEWTLRRAAGDGRSVPAVCGDVARGLADAQAASFPVPYVHDHVITIRRVLPDDTLVSMTAGNDTWYAFSLVTYARDPGAFLAVCRFLATSMALAYGARPHWGKLCPVEPSALSQAYPELPRFGAVAALFDPDGRFVNDFMAQVLGVTAQPT